MTTRWMLRSSLSGRIVSRTRLESSSTTIPKFRNSRHYGTPTRKLKTSLKCRSRQSQPAAKLKIRTTEIIDGEAKMTTKAVVQAIKVHAVGNNHQNGGLSVDRSKYRHSIHNKILNQIPLSTPHHHSPTNKRPLEVNRHEVDVGAVLEMITNGNRSTEIKPTQRPIPCRTWTAIKRNKKSNLTRPTLSRYIKVNAAEEVVQVVKGEGEVAKIAAGDLIIKRLELRKKQAFNEINLFKKTNIFYRLNFD